MAEHREGLPWDVGLLARGGGVPLPCTLLKYRRVVGSTADKQSSDYGLAARPMGHATSSVYAACSASGYPRAYPLVRY